jgi:ABC-type Fe3+ transport system permease subunit
MKLNKLFAWILCIMTLTVMVLSVLFYINCEIDLKYKYDIITASNPIDPDVLQHRNETMGLASCAVFIFIYASLVLLFIITSIRNRKAS